MKNLIVILVFFPLYLASQIKEYKFISDPLMQTEVNGFTEGANGDIYFFDNYDKLFLLRKDTLVKLNFSCSSCKIGDIFYEGKDSLLLMTEWSGLLRFANNQKSSVNSGLSDYNSICILKNGDIYIGSSLTNNKGLGKSVDHGKTFTYTKSSSNGLPSDIIYRLRKDTSDNLWLATFKGLTRLKAGTYKKYLNSKLTDNIYDLSISKKNSIWAQPSYGGIAKIDNDQLKEFRNYFPGGAQSFKVAVDSKGYGWTVYDDKLIRVTDSDSLQIPLSKFNITESICRSLFIDTKDRLFVGMAYRTDVLVIQLDYTSEVIESIPESVVIFPNPASDKVFINSDSDILSIEIFDLNGKIINSVKNANFIDVHGIRAGVYISKIKTTSTVFVKKILIE